MIFYGWRKKTLFLADMPMQPCTLCNRAGSLQLFVKYSSVHLYWIFGVITSRKYLAACSSCRGGARVDKHEIEHVITSNPIPFMDRWGLAILGALGCLAMALYLSQR